VNSLPVISIFGNTTICRGSIATLTASGGTNYSWSTGASTSVINVNPSSSASYTVTETNSNGCSSTGTINVTVSSPPIANVSGTTICSGQSATLSASGGGNYSWSNGNTTATINVSPTANTTYSVIVSAGSCADTASATVTVNPSPSISVSGNTALCTGDIATLTASGGASYLWSTGATTSSITAAATATATYSVVTTNGSCTSTASITVVVSSPPIASATSTTICSGQNATLTAFGGGNYLWSNGSTSAIINVSPTANTIYSVTVLIGTCSDTASATVLVNPVPIASAWSNVTITSGNSTTLAASGGGTYSWNNGMKGSVITVSPVITTGYCVTVSNGSCIDSACVIVYIEPIDCSTAGELYLPNAFSPNGDGENDVLQLYYGNMYCIQTFKLFIYNRWGERVFEAFDPDFSWDGFCKGKMEETAVFVYYMNATLISEEKISKKGNISLVR
jgi:gliding motility-associated-like protein